MEPFIGSLTCHILVHGKAPLSILVEQTASGRVAACSGASGRVWFGPGRRGHVYLSTGEARGAKHSREGGNVGVQLV